MLKQIHKLTALQLCNLFGLNEFRYTKDSKKKQQFTLLALAWFLIAAIVVMYIALMSVGLAKMGMSEIIPVYLYMITSLVILIFSFFKAAGIIFQMKNFEMLIALPLSQTAIVISRFLTMYATNLVMSLLVMLPGTVIYGIGTQPPLHFYMISFLGTLFLPLLPMTLSTAAGAVITGIGSRMKHKSLVTAALTILLASGIFIANMGLTSHPEQFTPDRMENLAETITDQIHHIFPPAIWFGNAAVHSDIISFILLIGVSLLIFALMVFLVQKYFIAISTALNTTSAKNNYKMKSLTTRPALKALWDKELKRYFASSIYVSNTMIGYILMLLLPIALLIAGPEKLELSLGYPGIVERSMPVLLGSIAAMMPMTSCAVSMEGKNWWLMQTLPVENKTILDSKLLAHLSVVLPFYLVSVLLSILALRPDFIGSLWLILIPAAYILFSSVAGITINLKFPLLNWENEAQVVKQSASTMITMLVDMLLCFPPMLCLIAFRTIPVNIIMGVTFVILVITTALLYFENNRRPLP